MQVKLLRKWQIPSGTKHNHQLLMSYTATKQHVANRSVPDDDFLDQLVAWGKRYS